MKPFSDSCERNQAEICSVLKDVLSDKKHVLEIGSGTGQHAVYFATRLPHIIWQTSDQDENHDGIQQWLDEANLENTHPPVSLNVSQKKWPDIPCDSLYSANVVHIMSWENVVDYFDNGAKLLPKDGLFILYGPFNYGGEFTSPSNADFDQWLKSNNPQSGIRDFEALDALANKNALFLKHDIDMAANNRILCWEKQ